MRKFERKVADLKDFKSKLAGIRFETQIANI